MERKLRICSVCGEKYNYCPRCREDENKPFWYFTFHSENCKNIYDVASKFENGQITADEAKARLDKLDLSNLDKFGESYQKTIEKINNTTIELKDKKNTESVDENIDNTETVEKEKTIKNSKKVKKDVVVE